MVSGIPTLGVSFGISGSFTAVSADLILSVSIRRGREQQNLFLESGTAYVILNNQSGAFDPSNTSSPWYGVLTAGMQVQISGNGIVLYTGYLEDNAVDQGIYPTVSLTFVDGMATFGKTMVPALATSQYQETAAARAGRILDLLGWSAGARSLTGTVQMLPTTLGLAGMDLLEQCANVIGGRFYVSRTGVATLVPLANKFSRPTQLLFSDQGDANSVAVAVIAGVELHQNVGVSVTHGGGGAFDKTNDAESSGGGDGGGVHSGVAVAGLGRTRAGALGSVQVDVVTQLGLGNRTSSLHLEHGAVVVDHHRLNHAGRVGRVVLREDQLTLGVVVGATHKHAHSAGQSAVAGERVGRAVSAGTGHQLQIAVRTNKNNGTIEDVVGVASGVDEERAGATGVR